MSKRSPRSDHEKNSVRLVLDKTQLDRVRAEAKKKSGDFTSAGEDDETAEGV
jgi:hypothetical protein